MSPVEMHEDEVRYYSSPVMVKTQQYMGTLTSERLIIEGGSAPREFKITNIVGAEPITLPSNEPGLKIVLSTPGGHKEMVWSFPVGDIFKAGEQQAWVDQIRKAIGDKPFAVPASQPASVRAVPTAAAASPQSPVYSPGEMEILKTAGVRIKRTYYTLYLTNLRLILQNSAGQIGREFAIAELMDASRMENESGEPAVALTIGSQTGVKQMILTFPSPGSREAWMVQLSAKLPAHVMPQVPPMMPQGAAVSAGGMGYGAPQAAQQPQMLTLQPGEKTYMSSPGVRVKRSSFTAYLTNTRFVLMGNTNGMLAIAGEFAVNTLKKAVRIAGELGEPGIGLTIVSRDGEKEMHLLFPSMDLREMWIGKFEEIIPPEQPQMFGAAASAAQYSVTTVTPPARGNAPVKYCTVCGARNHPDDHFCAMCGKPLGETGAAGAAAAAGSMSEPSVPDMFGGGGDAPRQRKGKAKREKRSRRDADEYDEPRERRTRERPPKRERAPKQPKERKPYEGGIAGFLTRPADAFAYYGRESPRDAVGLFLIAGVVWAVISVVMLAFVLPMILPITTADFPIIGALQSNMLAMVMLILVMLVLWIVFIMIQGVLSGVFAKVFGEDAEIGETMAVVMRSTLPYAAVGWIPGFGILIAAVWSLVATIKGFGAALEMRGGAAAGCGILGLVVVAVILVVLGIV
ncbi:MAG: YIP1 family protein [Methanocorpusculum sp.]|nr:YIP1 family protein [Methanocorpusculum sp.]